MDYGESYQFACFTNYFVPFAPFAYYPSVHFLGHSDLIRSKLSSPLISFKAPSEVFFMFSYMCRCLYW